MNPLAILQPSNILWLVGFIIFLWCLWKAFKWLLVDANRLFVINTMKSWKERKKAVKEVISNEEKDKAI